MKDTRVGGLRRCVERVDESFKRCASCLRIVQINEAGRNRDLMEGGKRKEEEEGMIAR